MSPDASDSSEGVEVTSAAGGRLCRGAASSERAAIIVTSSSDAAAQSSSDAAAQRGATVTSGLFNMANTILGAGMLGLPYAFSKCGLAVGLVLLLLFALLGALGLFLLSAAADIAGRPASFHGVAERALPGSGALIDAAIAVKCFGVATSYLIIVGDAMPQAAAPFGARGVLLDRRLWTAAAAVVVAPLAAAPRIDALRHASLVALVCVGLVTLLVLGFAAGAGPSLQPCPAGDDGCRGAVALVTTAPATLRALPTFVRRALRPMATAGSPSAHAAVPAPAAARARVAATTAVQVFAFTCHQNIISVTNELRAPQRADAARRRALQYGAPGTAPRARRTGPLGARTGRHAAGRAAARPAGEQAPAPRRARTVIGGAVGLALLQYLTLATAAFATYGDAVTPDVLNAYPASRLVAGARLSMALVVTLSYPLQAHPSRACVLSLLDAAARRRARRAACADRGPTGGAGAGAGAEAEAGADAGGADGRGPAGVEEPGDARASRRHARVTAAFLLASTALALSVDNLGTILSLVGATGSTTVSYLLPGLCYFRLCADPHAPLRWAALGLLGLGLGVMALSLVLILAPG